MTKHLKNNYNIIKNSFVCMSNIEKIASLCE